MCFDKTFLYTKVYLFLILMTQYHAWLLCVIDNIISAKYRYQNNGSYSTIIVKSLIECQPKEEFLHIAFQNDKILRN